MHKYRPLSISRPADTLLESKWPDGYSAVITLERFRDNCPCAVCVDVREKNSANPKVVFLGKYELKQLNPVGNYAVNAVWGDRHDSGIYDWKYFRGIFEEYAMSADELANYSIDDTELSKIIKIREHNEKCKCTKGCETKVQELAD